MLRSLVPVGLACVLLTSCGGSAVRDAASSTITGPAAAGALRVRVGDRSLAVDCQGMGSTTVLFESGLHDAGDVWAPLQRRLGGSVRSCRYDRAGLGASDPATGPRSLDEMAADLVAVTEEVAGSGRVVLVGHSFGGLVAAGAARRSERVAALVLVDSSTPQQFVDQEATLTSVWPTVRAFVSGGPDGVDIARSADAMAALGTAGVLGALPVESLRAGQQDPGLTALPADERTAYAARHRADVDRLHAMSRTTNVTVVAGAGHYVQRDAPDAVVTAIRRALGAG